jgi:hypothetical protein
MAIANTVVDSAPTDVYVSAGETAITFLSMCNYSANTVSVDLYLIPTGSTVSNASLFLKGLEITESDTYELYHAAEKLILSNNDKIVAVASAPNAVAVSISFVKV